MGLVQVRDRWRALVLAVLTLCFCYRSVSYEYLSLWRDAIILRNQAHVV